MKFTKPPLTFEQQADLLIQRGMVADRALLISRLSSVSYYRLSGYWYHRKLAGDAFMPGTQFDVIWEQYVFDRQLRLLVMDSVERIEVAVRTLLSYHHAHAHGPFAYASDPPCLPSLGAIDRTDLLDNIHKDVVRSKEKFVEHFADKYGDQHDDLPAWMATEVMSFGSVLRLLGGCSDDVKDAVAAPFGVSRQVLRSWLWSLNEVRNVCAHHGRLWNRELGNKPLIPRHQKEWHTPVLVPNHRVFALLTVSNYCLRRIAPQSAWPKRLRALLAAHPEIPKRNMGFPDKWLQSPLWTDAKGASTP